MQLGSKNCRRGGGWSLQLYVTISLEVGFAVFVRRFFSCQMANNEEFYPQNLSQPSEEHYGPPKKQQKYISGPHNGIWADLQHTKYIVFMEFHKEKMRSKEKRRSNKLYKTMAEYIQTRNAFQCRSHHQKLEEKYLYPNKIIFNFKQHNDLTLYHQLRQDLEEQHTSTPSRPTYNLKLQESIPEKEAQYLPSPQPEAKEAEMMSTPTSPHSVGQSAPLSNFRICEWEQVMTPLVYNWCPYFVYPMFQLA